jgi:hypothetical protein
VTIIQRGHSRLILLGLALLAPLALTAGCGGAAATGAHPVSQATPDPFLATTSPIPAHPKPYTRIPAACSLLNAAALRALGLGRKGTAQPTQRDPGLQEEYCTWGGPGVTRSKPGLLGGQRLLTVVIDLFTVNPEFGQAPAAAAKQQFQQEVSSQAQIDNTRAEPVHGLASQASIVYVARGTLGQGEVLVLDQNVMINAVYAGPPSSGRPASRAVADDGALAAARAALTTLSAPR